MIVIKKDFVDETTKSFCGNRPLSSGKAYYMLDTNGTIHYAGKQCAEENSNTDLSQIPDLTKSLISNHEGSHSGGGSTGGDKENIDLTKSKAITYLILREEKLINYKCDGVSVSYSQLNKYFQKYINDNELSKDEINHIINLEKYSASKINKKMSLNNLSTCYTYEYILNRILSYLKDNNKPIEYVEGLVKYLKEHCFLSDKQVDGLEQWLQYLPDELRTSKRKKFTT